MCFSKAEEIQQNPLDQKAVNLSDIGLDKIDDTCNYINLEDVSTLNVSHKDLLVLQLNIRGLISKQSDISKLITNCTKTSKKVGVVLLCETWVTNNTKGLINIPGYKYIGIERKNKKGGGVGLLVANELKFKIRD